MTDYEDHFISFNEGGFEIPTSENVRNRDMAAEPLEPTHGVKTYKWPEERPIIARS